MTRLIKQQRGVALALDNLGGADDAAAPLDRNSSRLSSQELALLLEHREAQLQFSTSGGLTDQWRVYSEITDSLSTGRRLRMLVQGAAGAGKSFMMSTAMLWCIVNGKKAKALAPTSFASSNIEIEGTNVSVTTLQSMFDLDHDSTATIDFSKTKSNKKMEELLELSMLFLDEISPIDVDMWCAMAEMRKLADNSRKPDVPADGDPFGNISIVFLGDFNQLLPVTLKPPVIVTPRIFGPFSKRVLRHNRRIRLADSTPPPGEEDRTAEERGDVIHVVEEFMADEDQQSRKAKG
eukprot:2278410-Karenia_brevis.AAC.1